MPPSTIARPLPVTPLCTTENKQKAPTDPTSWMTCTPSHRHLAKLRPPSTFNGKFITGGSFSPAIVAFYRDLWMRECYPMAWFGVASWSKVKALSLVSPAFSWILYCDMVAAFPWRVPYSPQLGHHLKKISGEAWDVTPSFEKGSFISQEQQLQNCMPKHLHERSVASLIKELASIQREKRESIVSFVSRYEVILSSIPHSAWPSEEMHTEWFSDGLCSPWRFTMGSTWPSLFAAMKERVLALGNESLSTERPQSLPFSL
eukprot:Gb_34073 [translate_table: standard]